MFDGEPIDEHTKEMIRISLENSMRMAKQLAKQKFTPNKYKKIEWSEFMDIKEFVLNITEKHGTTNPFEIAKQKILSCCMKTWGILLAFTTLINALNLFILIIKLTKPLNALFVHMN